MQDDHVFKIIHSMNKKEKIHFAKYATMNQSDTKFLQLYQAVNKMKVYDEGKLKKKFRHSFDSLKFKLYSKLLDSLTDFYKSGSENSFVYQSLTLLPVLYEKKLWYPFKKRLKKACIQAEKNENWAASYKLLDWEKEYLQKSLDNKGLAEKYASVCEQQNRCITAQQQETYWQNIYFQLNFILRDDYRLLKKDNRNHFEQVGNLSKVDSKTLLSIKAQFYYHRSRNIYYRGIGQVSKALQHAEHLLHIIESKEPNSRRYTDALCSLSRTYTEAGKFKEQAILIDKLKQLPQLQNDDIVLFEKTCQIRVLYYLNTYQFEALVQLSNVMYDRWEDMKKHLNLYLQQGYSYNFIVNYWILADYSNALFWIAIILDYKFTPEGKNYLMGARLLELMIYYDYRSIELDNRLDSVRHVLKEHWEIGDYEKAIFTFFNQLIRKPKSEHLAVFQNFYDNLKPYTEKRLIASRELSCWCHSKITGKTLREAIIENN